LLHEVHASTHHHEPAGFLRPHEQQRSPSSAACSAPAFRGAMQSRSIQTTSDGPAGAAGSASCRSLQPPPRGLSHAGACPPAAARSSPSMQRQHPHPQRHSQSGPLSPASASLQRAGQRAAAAAAPRCGALGCCDAAAPAAPRCVWRSLQGGPCARMRAAALGIGPSSAAGAPGHEREGA
jgi:hypothetical protein